MLLINKNKPRIAIIGSLDESRQDIHPPLKKVEQAKQAAVALGYQLAEQGYEIVVYSGLPNFVEKYVVDGYVKSKKATKQSIHVHYPSNSEHAAEFEQYEQYKKLFDLQPDNSDYWQNTFYRSIKKVDGLLLIGGGRSTFVAGQIALVDELPLLAFGSFGGNSALVWSDCSSNNPLLETGEAALLAGRWEDEKAKLAVNLLGKQGQRAQQRREADLNGARKKERVRSISALMIFCLAILMIPIGLNLELADKLTFLICMCFSPILAGASGALARSIHVGDNNDSFSKNAFLGAMAGGVSSLLYVAAQFVTNPTIFDFTDRQTALPSNLFFFTVVIGLVAGFTSDKVFKSMQELNALKGETLVKGNKRG